MVPLLLQLADFTFQPCRLLCPARQLPFQLCAVTLKLFDLRCRRGVGLTLGLQQFHCAQNALFQGLKIRHCQGFRSLLRQIHCCRRHTSSLH